MRTSIVRWTLFAVAAFAPAACMTEENGAPEELIVEMDHARFSPDVLDIRAGDTVVWENTDIEPHTVTSGVSSTSSNAGQLFDELLQPGESYQYTFSQSGEVPYFCRIHEAEGMRGRIVVGSSSPF
ncbi:MAG: cupredoxin domain-containing protein [Deltaproteobacteria bacterium]|nr:cupredoxin domain-containing protein [Deltaproteobacteria bacterium]